jgi:type II secretory pathway pseudopilin PulG
MKQYNIIKPSPSQQRGIALLEALISLVIITIACAGSLYVVSRANVTKTEMSMQHITVHTLQQKLSNHHATRVDDNACAEFHVHLPGHDNALTVNKADPNSNLPANATCVPAVSGGGKEVKVDGVVIPLMQGRIILTADNTKNLLSGDIVVGGS